MRHNHEYQLGKVPPQAVDVEGAVLGACLLEQDAFETVKGIVRLESFYKPEHRTIFEAILTVSMNRKPVDLLTITRELKDRGKLDEVGGPLYITQLTDRVASAAHIETHARIIAEKFYLREVIRVSGELAEMAYNNIDVDEIDSFIRRSIEKLDDVFSVADLGMPIKTVLRTAIREIENDCIMSSKQQTPGITTGFGSLDTSTGGWRPGNLLILAARPGVGKSSFAIQFMLEAAKAGHWINFFSFEMTKVDIARIMLSSESNVYRGNVRDGHLNQSDFSSLNAAIRKLEELPVIFKDSPGMTVGQIQSTIKKNRKNGRCDFVIIDYLQLIRPTDPKAIREQQIAEISRTLKTTALDQNIPIMALSQLNRAADGEQPKLSHLRESGAIEQDADLVMFLHREMKNTIRLTVAKHRRGQLGEIDILSNGDMTRFRELQDSDACNFHKQEFEF
jgi:replicative DNA helicase